VSELSDTARRLIAAAMQDGPDAEAVARTHGSVVSRVEGDRSPELVTAPRRSGEPSASPEPGQKIGRYHLLERIGQGAMGVVYHAYDPDLARAVALKLVNPSFGSHVDADGGRKRLVAEARALAKLTHPNVTVVHDVGVHERHVWLAMELVDGDDLAAWLAAQPRESAEIVRVFREAARGLAAAHDVGLVHRDFKPANVLIARDGRVRISDFGLARTHATAIETPLPDEISALGPTDCTLTRDGVVMGTPAYMAPEQHRGGDVGPAADQYGFFVALYEALWGRRPFAGSMTEIAIAKELGPPAPDTKSNIARRWWPIVRKGLAPDPLARHPSMHAVVDALRERSGRARVGLAAAIGVGTLGLAAWVFGPWPVTCKGSDELFAGVWDDVAAREIDSAFLATEHPSARRAAERVAQRLDRYGETWAAAHRDACEATRVRGDQSEALLDRRVACLEQRRRAAGALVDVFRRADHDVVDRSLEAVALLPGISRCANAVALDRSGAPDDPALRREVDELRAELAEASARWQAGRFDEGVALAGPLLERAEALDWAPLHAEALFVRAKLIDGAGDPEAAVADLKRAVWIAQSAGADPVVAEAAVALLFIESEHLGAARRAIDWGRLAEATLERIGGDEDLQRILLDNLASAHGNAADYDEALVLFERLLALDAQRPPDDENAAITLSNYAKVLAEVGRLEDAANAFDRATKLMEGSSGPDTARLGLMQHNLGVVLSGIGRHDEALHKQELAAAVLERALGPDHPWLVSTLLSIAMEHERSGHDDAALPHLERACRLAESGEARLFAACLHGLGSFHARRGRAELAVDPMTRAIALVESERGADHPDLLAPLHGLATAYMALDRHEEALGLLQRMRTTAETAQGEHERDLGLALSGLAEVLRARGEHERALELQREAIEHLQGDDVPSAQLALAHLLVDLGRLAEADAVLDALPRGALDADTRYEAEFVRARRLDAEGRRDRAIDVATRARDELHALGPAGIVPAAEIDAWLRTH
jgi:tetratricopeptide (TPR) repeat protein